MSEPLRLFKYFSPDKLVFFENCLVLLTPPIYLNDPWDFLPGGRVASEEEIQKACLENERHIAQTSIIHLPADFAQRQHMQRAQSMRTWAKSKEFVEGLSIFSQERFPYGVVSLTEKPLCRLMWAHYAESHAGFVVEFVTGNQVEYEGLTACGCDVGPVACAFKVRYPRPFTLQPWTRENIANACCSKHPAWEYEQEWRILWELNKSIPFHINSPQGAEQRYCLQFAPTNLKNVIFGMRMKPEVKQRLDKMLNQDEFKHVQKQTTFIDNETGELILKPLS